MTDYLLALAVDHLAIGNWLFTTAHSDSSPPDPPEPIPRPVLTGSAQNDEEDEWSESDPPVTTSQELAAFFTH
ncbi:hypothetical protein GCM10009550_05450 [Actinocorallia libanotica]|uniref:Uncharacterized protein n=1 Tax=Actinocorallia libanotica TaxID=46162 RepID=A0ABN1Q618_9ACTN